MEVGFGRSGVVYDEVT